MKKPILVLLAVLALLPLAQLLAQAPPVAVSPSPGATAPSPGVAQFLATLSGVQAPVPGDWVPAPLLRTSCSTSADCPTGQLCCNVCGNPPDDGGSCRACVMPIRGRCPLVV